MHDATRWNYARSSLGDDVIFICPCINAACSEEIEWPDAEQRRELGRQIPAFPGCIGFIDGTLVRIRRPHNDNHMEESLSGEDTGSGIGSNVKSV